MSKSEINTTLLSPGGITALTFNKDRSKVCYATASHELVVAAVLGTDVTKWKEEFRSTMHDMTISHIDWVETGPKSSKIVSCGHDRVAYVYTSTDGGKSYDPEMVTLAVPSNRGALTCSWSASGQRFVVGTATHTPSVCIKDHDNNWWNAKALKGHDGAVTCAAYCPTEDALLATGGTDGSLRVVSTALKDIDDKATLDKLGKFGTELCTVRLSSVWLNSVAWNQSGTLLAAVAHDSTLHVLARVPESNEFAAFPAVRLRTLSPRCVVFAGERTVVVAGADRHPAVFTVQETEVVRAGQWSAERVKSGAAQSSVQSAMTKFQNEAALGQATKVDVGSMHHLCDITSLFPIKVSDTGYSVATAAMDGRVVIWTAADVKK